MRANMPPGNDKQQQILKKRALALAVEPKKKAEEEQIEIVEFLLSGERYAIESAFISEVYPLKNLTPLPCTPVLVVGVITTDFNPKFFRSKAIIKLFPSPVPISTAACLAARSFWRLAVW